jgi:hypothetical protein
MLIIDRFEGDFAVVEYDTGKLFNLSRFLLPPEAEEGDVISMTLTINSDETAKRRKRIQSLMDDLFE